MSRFLFAWELGAGLGHVVPLAQVAAPLLAHGHEVDFVLRELSDARAGLGPLADAPGVRLWQAPVWLPALQGLPPSACYAELLFRAGYLEGARLRGLVRGWKNLLEAIRPDLLLADHAPTALLAARLLEPGKRLRRAVIGNGFFIPPAITPGPSFREGEAIDARRLAAAEARVLAECNSVLVAESDGRATPLAALHELVAADETFLVTWPELDPYGGGSGRPGASYWGALPAREAGEAPVWPEGASAPLLAYLKADYAKLDDVLQQLAAAPCRTLVHVPGLPRDLRQRWQGPRLRFSDGPLAMAAALAEATAVVCHAGAGTVAAALRAGRPLLMLPMQAEQLLQAQRVVATGAGRLLRPEDLRKQLRDAAAALAGDSPYRVAAQALALRHAGDDPTALAERIARRCLALAEEARL